jgi:pimeloyl-ACP methyl ester carboxylesterase
LATLVDVHGAQLEVFDRGAGEPVVLIQTALTADELAPLAAEPAIRRSFRTVLYHRRGYGGSSPADGPGSVARDAADCRAMLSQLGIDRAHIVGLSYSAAVALQLAVDAPPLVHTLTLLEPPPVHVPSADEFRAANARLSAARNSRGLRAALDEFLALVIGPHWRRDIENFLPGSVEQVERDAGTFFDTDLPALLDWQFNASTAGRIGCPVLYVGGTDSGPWFAQVHALFMAWLPQAEDVVLSGADHSLAITHSREIGTALGAFLLRNSMT